MITNNMKACFGRLILLTSIFFLSVHAIEANSAIRPLSDSPRLRLPGSLASRAFVAPHAENIRKDVLPASSAIGLFKRAGSRWSREEDELLLKLRGEDIPWAEMKESFPNRTWKALVTKYTRLTAGRPAPNPENTRKSWTRKEDKRLLQLREAGESWEEIANNLPDRSPGAAYYRYRLLTKRIRAPERTVKQFTREEDDQIIKAVESGMSVKEISQLVGRTEMSVRKHMDVLDDSGRINVSLSLQRPYSDAELELMHEMRKQKMRWKEIARRHFPGRDPKALATRYYAYMQEKKSEESKE